MEEVYTNESAEFFYKGMKFSQNVLSSYSKVLKLVTKSLLCLTERILFLDSAKTQW